MTDASSVRASFARRVQVYAHSNTQRIVRASSLSSSTTCSTQFVWMKRTDVDVVVVVVNVGSSRRRRRRRRARSATTTNTCRLYMLLCYYAMMFLMMMMMMTNIWRTRVFAFVYQPACEHISSILAGWLAGQKVCRYAAARVVLKALLFLCTGLSAWIVLNYIYKINCFNVTAEHNHQTSIDTNHCCHPIVTVLLVHLVHTTYIRCSDFELSCRRSSRVVAGA